MILNSSTYSISEKFEPQLLQHKEAVNNKTIEFPDIVEDIGLKGLLGDSGAKEYKKLN
jgi:hypothetical protein